MNTGTKRKRGFGAKNSRCLGLRAPFEDGDSVYIYLYTGLDLFFWIVLLMLQDANVEKMVLLKKFQ